MPNPQHLTANIQSGLYEQIRSLLGAAKEQVWRSVNQTMLLTYFEVGRLIVEDEQQGKERAEYAGQILAGLSERLTQDFGKGFSVDNLENMRKMYLTYANSETVSRNSGRSEVFPLPALSWSHYLLLIRIENEAERQFYEQESASSRWSVRELKRQFNSALYERLALSRDKEGVRKLSEKGLELITPADAIKDPYILEFLGLPEETAYSESELEQAVIDKLEHFLLELGKGFTFAARQQRISFDEKHFYVDLVFYNRLLRCFLLIDLKIGELTHQDIGQLQMYVNYYDRVMKLPEENLTIGLILCKDKSDTLVRYTLPEDNTQIFASRYQMVLPSHEELSRLIKEGDG
jgi:predicted nuclease of restriction endonuclease-like (RecB) superfamily